MIADELYDRIKIEYEQAYGPISDDHENPVRKVQLIVTGSQGQVYMDEIGDNNDNGGGGGGISNRAVEDRVTALQSQVHTLHQSVDDLTNRLEMERIITTRYFETINNNVRRIAIQAAQPV